MCPPTSMEGKAEGAVWWQVHGKVSVVATRQNVCVAGGACRQAMGHSAWLGGVGVVYDQNHWLTVDMPPHGMVSTPMGTAWGGVVGACRIW